MDNRSRFYRNKFIIALYDEDDFLVEVADNTIELIIDMGKEVNESSLNRVRSALRHALVRENPRIYFRGILCNIHLIPMFEDVP